MRFEKRDKKAAIELSMTTIIVIIMGVVLLSLGLVFLRTLFGKITMISDEAFRIAEQEIQAKMGSDERFYIPGISFEVKIGKSITVNTGVQNLENIPVTQKFKIVAKGENADWIKVPEAMPIPPGEKKGIPIILTVPKTAKLGDTHFFTFEVQYDSTVYDTQTITLKIV